MDESQYRIQYHSQLREIEKLQHRIAWMTDIGTLAGIIRLVDGNHTLGAGALAEAIVNQWTILSDKAK